MNIPSNANERERRWCVFCSSKGYEATAAHDLTGLLKQLTIIVKLKTQSCRRGMKKSTLMLDRQLNQASLKLARLRIVVGKSHVWGRTLNCSQGRR